MSCRCIFFLAIAVLLPAPSLGARDSREVQGKPLAGKVADLGSRLRRRRALRHQGRRQGPGRRTGRPGHRFRGRFPRDALEKELGCRIIFKSN